MTVNDSKRTMPKKLVLKRVNREWPESFEPVERKQGNKSLAIAKSVAVWAIKPNIGLLSNNANPMGVRPGYWSSRFKAENNVDKALLASDEYQSFSLEKRYRLWIDNMSYFNRPQALKNYRRAFLVNSVFTFTWLFVWIYLFMQIPESPFSFVWWMGLLISGLTMLVKLFSIHHKYQVVLNERLIPLSESLHILFKGGRIGRQ